MNDLTSTAKSHARRVADKTDDAHEKAGEKVAPIAKNPWLRGIARGGFIVMGLVYALIGWTAIRIAIGQEGADSADQSGAVKIVEAVPGGAVVLIIAAAALGALGAFMVLEGISASSTIDDRTERTKTLWRHLGKAAGALALMGTIIAVLQGIESDSEAAAEDTSSQLMQSWFGTALLVAAALVVIGVGVAFGVIGITRSFEKDLDLSQAGRFKGPVIAITVVGYLARGLAFALIGVTFIAAVISRDPSDASGMSGALKALTDLPFGDVALVIVGCGLILGGIATALRAWFHKM